MKYYVFIKNDIEEWIVYSVKNTKEEAEKSLLPLFSANFPKEKTKIERAAFSKSKPMAVSIEFVQFNGNISTYPIHTDQPKREFFVAVELVLSKQLTNIQSVILRDGRNAIMHEYSLGKILRPVRPQK